MRVVYVCQSYPPMVSGAALVVQRLAKGMAMRGHTVSVFAASDKGQAYTNKINGLKQVRLTSFPNPLRVDQYFTIWPRRQIANELKAFRPDVLHMHDPLLIGLSALSAGHAFGVPVTLTIHQLPWFVSAYAPALPGLRKMIETGLWTYSNWLLQQCEAVITPSRVIADIVSGNNNCHPEVISNGVELERFSPRPAFADENESLRQRYGLDPQLPIILYVGRIDTDKQVELVVHAAAQTMRSVKAQLLVVGDGKQLDTVSQLSEALGIRDKCQFPGYVPVIGDLPGLYRLASVFVTASELEIQSSVVLEAAATGLPIVAFRSSSMPEIVENGVTGYLVTPRDVSALADRITSLVRNPNQAKAMGLAGRASAETHSLDSSIRTHEKLYQSLTSSSELMAR